MPGMAKHAKENSTSVVGVLLACLLAVCALGLSLLLPAAFAAELPAAADAAADTALSNGSLEATAVNGATQIALDASADAASMAENAVDKAKAAKEKAAVVKKALKKARSISSATDYFIAVDIAAKRTIVFKWNGEDWAVEKNWLCSTGAPESPTVLGTYDVVDKGYSFSKDGYTCYYYTQFFGNYLLHSVKYDEGTFDVKDGRLGEAISEGCVRLKLNAAKWIYDTVPVGTRIVLYE